MIHSISTQNPQSSLFQVPPGHVVQQLLDPNGTLQHVIFTPDPMAQPQPPMPQPQSHHGVPIQTPYSSAMVNASPAG